ncbi:FHA domain-containing protein [uncultured Ruminococcus sp.]|uniref:FHA domain-containing protein n=1 Tax=uncultured Ruminococcus sp. TaxID=165186 RepID=UPI002602F4CD|nr:FHA domain-containing protein [uncultured Ruminococcus sp.]
MAKFKVLEKQGQIGIRCKLTGNEQINSGEILYFSQNFIKGFMQPSVEDAGKLIFIGAQGVPLSRFLKQVITKEQFFPIVAQVIEIYKAAVNRNLPLQNVVLSPDFIVINPNTGEMSFVYAAITTPQPMNDGYTSCMNRIASIAHFATQEDLNAVGNFLNFINGLGSFSVPEMESYIMKAAPITYNIVIRQPFNPPAAQPAPAAAPQTAPVQEAAPAAPVQEVKPESAPVQETKPEPVKEEEKPAVQSAPAVQIPQPAPVEAPPVIHADEAKVKEIKAPEAPAAPEDKAPEPVQEVKQPEPEVKKPEPVQEVKKPEPVKESTPAEQPAPKLTRRSNGETFSVNKPVFKLGKERAKVDFCITGNKTVSRVHATLYVRGGECFVQDNNSTNRTFVNGEPIAVQTEIKLKKGDVLKLSNEEFDFIG